MSSAVDRLVSAFVAPAAASGRTQVAPEPPPRPRPQLVAVLSPPALGLAAGAAVALGRGRGRGPVVLSLLGVQRPAFRGPTPRSTAKLAARMAERGHEAAPAGRLVVVVVGDAAEALRVVAASASSVVTVFARPRDGEVDRALVAHDCAVVVGDEVVADLAATSVAALGLPTDVLSLPDAPAAKVLATAGIALAASWRRAVDGTLS